ncbi:MAG: ABC transporter ATP-binding protein [Coriobacteriales bacterium]|jgi:ABC-2 type transport system ATP-binding protein|nr:ABC transporter ATP-binding protein [Coriobacteriales bacterium]
MMEREEMMEATGCGAERTPESTSKPFAVNTSGALTESASAGSETSHTGYAIEFTDVSLRYPGTREDALHKVSFRLPCDTICGLFGRNGAGKTSIMALLAGLRQPSAGTVRVFGQDPFENTSIVPHVSYIYLKNAPDDLMNAYKARRYLQMGALFRPQWDGDYARFLLKRFDIPEKKTASKMSQGQRAALRCVIGLASRAPLSIFDEAYLGMDAVYRHLFIDELLADYLRFPRTILFSTHYISEMERLFSEVLIIDDGRVLLHDEADTLRKEGQSLADLFISLTLKEGESYDA